MYVVAIIKMMYAADS